jgi:DNA-binding transcriptional regulator YbjK
MLTQKICLEIIERRKIVQRTKRRLNMNYESDLKRQTSAHQDVDYLLLTTWIIIQAANPIASITVTADARVAIKAMLFLSRWIVEINWLNS